MEQKRVSFKVAKAIKEAGYPQGDKNSGNCDVYPLEDHDKNFSAYTRVGKLSTRYHCQNWTISTSIPYVIAPTYLEVWLWLWREKSIELDVEYSPKRLSWYCWHEDFPLGNNCKDQEEAIIAAIEYLVDNDLVK